MRVMTYNIRGGLGMDGRRSDARIAQAIKSHAPDLVCFQEVHQRLPWSGFVDQPRSLERLLGMPLIFQRNLRIGFGGYGLGMATHSPVLAVERRLLPSVKEQRGALEVRLHGPEGPLTVFCTHWGLDAKERERQARQMAEWIAAAPPPVIVCGDLNDRPEAPSIRELLARTGLLDADVAADRPTYPADAPAARIDYVFYSPDLRLERLTPVATLASDHLPLLAVFSPPHAADAI